MLGFVFSLVILTLMIVYTVYVVKYGAGYLASQAYDNMQREYDNHPETLIRFEGNNILAFGLKSEFSRRRGYITGLIELKKDYLIIHKLRTKPQFMAYSEIDLDRTKYDLKRNWIYLYFKNDYFKYFVRPKSESDESIIAGFAMHFGILKKVPASLEAKKYFWVS